MSCIRLLDSVVGSVVVLVVLVVGSVVVLAVSVVDLVVDLVVDCRRHSTWEHSLPHH